MNLTEIAIKRNRVTFSLLAMIILMGIAAYAGLSRDSMPPYTIRVATIVSRFPGANPERVELLVSKNIEETVQELPEVKEITSQSRTGLSVVTVTLKDEVAPNALQAIWDSLRRKLEDMEGLPDGVIPDLNDDDVGVVYGVMVGLLSNDFSDEELEQTAKKIRDDLITLPDSAKVELNGVQEQQVFVEFDPVRLGEFGLTVGKLQQQIQATNILDSGGEISVDDKRLVLEPSGNFETLHDLKRLLIPVGSEGRALYLGDIASIRQATVLPPQSLVRVNGQRAVAISIALKEGANIVALGEMVDQRIVGYNQTLPLGMDVIRLASLDAYVQKSINDFTGNLIQSIVVVLLVMLVFLGLRTGLVVAALIPMVTIMTLLLMGVIDMGLNQVTLAALIMALGMMVDNGIVVSESMLVKLQAGDSRMAAATATASEMSIPLLISTLTTSAAFLAFYLAESIMGDIVGPLFVVISLALLSSWILSLTVIPLLGYYFIRIKNKGRQRRSIFDWLRYRYLKALPWVLKTRLVFVIGMLLLFVISLKGFGMVPFIFFPDSDRNLVTVDINLPLGTKIETTLAVTAAIDAHIQNELLTGPDRKRGVEDWSAYIGQGPQSYDLGYSADEANSSYAHMLINTSHGDDNQMVIDNLSAFSLEQFPDADIRVKRLGQGGGGTPVEIRILGESPDQLFQLAAQVKGRLSEIPGTRNISDDWGPKLMKFTIDIDQAKAQSAGLTNYDIATSLKTVLSGVKTGVFRKGTDSLSIIMRSADATAQTIASIENTNIYAQSSGKVAPLSQVAEMIPQWDYAKIIRRDLKRSITIKSYITAEVTAQEVVTPIRAWLEETTPSWPAGYTYELGGDQEQTEENMGAVIAQLPLSAFIILMLLVIQFNSFRKTFMVLSTVPLGVIGVVIGLIVLRSYFGFFGFLGVISLAGIVINNAIVLIDRMDMEQTAFNRTPQEAIVEACGQRFRPILLTTFTTTLGLIPLYLGGGLMWEPLAVAIMAGLLFATVITLLFIPALYSLLYGASFKKYTFD